MDLLNPKIETYLEGLLPPSGPVLEEMEAYARSVDFPIVGPQVGRLLQQLCLIHRPRTMFEMGSGFGYAAAWLLRGAPGATLVCTELDVENIERARAWLTREGCHHQATWKHADALEVLAGSGCRFDLLFNDIDKERYPDAFHVALEHLEPGGLLVTDNVLWRGQVVEAEPPDAPTAAVVEYNRLLFETPGLHTTIIPVRDGVAVSRWEGPARDA